MIDSCVSIDDNYYKIVLPWKICNNACYFIANYHKKWLFKDNDMGNSPFYLIVVSFLQSNLFWVTRKIKQYQKG